MNGDARNTIKQNEADESPDARAHDALAQLAGDVVDRYDEDRDLDEPIEALRDHFTLALPPTTPNGYDRRWIDAINVVLADRKARRQIEDIDDALWERFIGPMIDSIEGAGIKATITGSPQDVTAEPDDRWARMDGYAVRVELERVVDEDKVPVDAMRELLRAHA